MNLSECDGGGGGAYDLLLSGQLPQNLACTSDIVQRIILLKISYCGDLCKKKFLLDNLIPCRAFSVQDISYKPYKHEHTCKLLASILIMYFIILWISYVVYCLIVFYCFIISAVWDLHVDQFFCLNELNMKPRENKLTDFQTKLQTTLCHFFCTQNEQLFFWVDLRLQKVMWLLNGMSQTPINFPLPWSKPNS